VTDTPINDNAKPAAEKFFGLGAEGKWMHRVADKGWGSAIKQGAGEMQFWKAGNHKGVAFGRIAGVGAGVALAGDALFRGKTGDGEQRGFVTRVLQFGTGAAVAAGSLAAGR